MDNKIIKLKIDVSKIDKNRLFKGQKGTYLDATLFLSETPDQYGNNGMIVQDVSAEERQSGVKGAILGNAKEFVRNNPAPAPKREPQHHAPEPIDDDLPF
jgi:hypothetical protein